MKFIDYLSESRFNTGSDFFGEKKRAYEFMSRFGGNLFTIKSTNMTIEYKWSIHAMSRFIERNKNPESLQKLLLLINEEFYNFKEGRKYLVRSKRSGESIVVVKDDKNDHKLTIITVYPDKSDNDIEYKNVYMVEHIVYDEEIVLEG